MKRGIIQNIKIVFCQLLLFCTCCFSFAQDLKDTITVLSFNDFHGAFVEDAGIPGAAIFTQAMIEAKNNNPNTIIVSAGDNFSGSYFARITKGEPFHEMCKRIGVDVSAVGNHEFDWGIPFFKDTAIQKLNYVAANIYQTDNYEIPEWINPYYIIEKKLKDGNQLKIALIGLTTTEIPQKTDVDLSNYVFYNPLGVAAMESMVSLKKEGKIDMIFLLTHLGTNMDSLAIFEDKNACLLPYLDNINAIITGHSHKVVLAQINNVPIIQANVNGTYIGKLQFEITSGSNIDQKYKIIRYIGGDTMRVQSQRKDIIVDSLVSKYITENTFDEVLTIATEDLIHDRNENLHDFTIIGAYVADSYVSIYKKEMNPKENAIIIGGNHFKGIRSGISEGNVTKLKAGNVLPFGGKLAAYNFNGKKLKKLLESSFTNKNGYFQTSDLCIITDKNNKIQNLYSLHGKREMEITDESPIVLVVDSYITTGKDGYDATLFFDNEIEDFNQKNIKTTETFISYLKEKKNISEKKAPKVKKLNKKE